MWCACQDSNLGILVYQTSAFTGLGYKRMVGSVGLEPTSYRI